MMPKTVNIILNLDLVNVETPLANEDMVSSMGAVRNSVSPFIANRTTT